VSLNRAKDGPSRLPNCADGDIPPDQVALRFSIRWDTLGRLPGDVSTDPPRLGVAYARARSACPRPSPAFGDEQRSEPGPSRGRNSAKGGVSLADNATGLMFALRDEGEEARHVDSISGRSGACST